MSTIAPTLETALLLMASLYPVGFCSNITVLLRGPRGFKPSDSLSGDLSGFALGFAAICAVVALVRPERVLVFHPPPFLPLLVLAPLAGVARLWSEYFVGMLLVFLRSGKLVTRVAIHSSYSAVPRITPADVLVVVAVVMGEELVLRQLLYNLVTVDLGASVGKAVALCSVVYALNHLSFGVGSVIAKIPSGLVYVGLYCLSGRSIGVVIIAHATQNLTLLALSRRRRLVGVA